MGLVHYTIPDELHTSAKLRAAADGVTLRAFIVLALMTACYPEEYCQVHEPAAGAVD